jgi:MFS family permease
VTRPRNGPAQTTRRGGALLRHHDFRLLWLGESTSAVGTSISSIALPLVAVVSLQASAFQVSALTAAAWLPWLMIGLPAGSWVDRLPRRPVMQVCNIVCLLLLLSVPIAAWSGTLTIGQLLAVALLKGVASVFFETAYQVFLPAVVGAGDLTGANAALQGSESVAQVAGPGLAGLLAQLVGAVAGLVADAVSFLVSTVCLVFIQAQDEPTTNAARPTPLRSQIADGVRFVRADPYLRVLTVFGATSNLALTGYQAILIVLLVRDLGVSPGVMGLLISGMSVGGILGAASGGALARRYGTARAMLACELVGAPFALLIPLTSPGLGLLYVVAGGIGVGAGIVSGNVIRSSFRQTYTPRHLLGRVIVTMQFLNYGTIPLGALLAGALAATLGLRPTLWIMASGVTLASLILLIGPIRHQRDLPARPAPRSDPLAPLVD